jgi:hypothetical protein
MNSKTTKGQTLLEVLIAISILVVVLVTTISLIVASIKAGRESTNKLIGTSLARETVEPVRNIRDSNWAATATSYWDGGLVNATDYPNNLQDVTFTPVISLSGSAVPLYLDPTPDAFTDEAHSVVKQSGSEYVQGLITTGTRTQFFRMAYLNPICQDADGNEKISNQTEQAVCGQGGTSVSAYPNKVGIRVIVEVRWPAPDSNKHVTIEDHLYNWQVL